MHTRKKINAYLIVDNSAQKFFLREKKRLAGKITSGKQVAINGDEEVLILRMTFHSLVGRVFPFVSANSAAGGPRLIAHPPRTTRIPNETSDVPM